MLAFKILLYQAILGDKYIYMHTYGCFMFDFTENIETLLSNHPSIKNKLIKKNAS